MKGGVLRMGSEHGAGAGGRRGRGRRTQVRRSLRRSRRPSGACEASSGQPRRCQRPVRSTPPKRGTSGAPGCAVPPRPGLLGTPLPLRGPPPLSGEAWKGDKAPRQTPKEKYPKDNLRANQGTCSRRQTHPARINKGRRELAAPPVPRPKSQPKAALKRVPGEARPVGIREANGFGNEWKPGGLPEPNPTEPAGETGFAAHPLSGDGGRRLKKGLGRRVRT